MPDKSFLKDDAGVNAIIEYMITLMLSVLIFSMIISSSQYYLIDNPRKTVCKNQLIDIGNDIDTKLFDTYLVAPEAGIMTTNFSIPEDAASYSYMVVISTSPNGDDKEVSLVNDAGDIQVNLTLNGVSSTIPIAGNTSSRSATHTIIYESE